MFVILIIIDPFGGKGTTYIHGDTLEEHNRASLDSNMTSGALVAPITLATTFRQQTPGQARAQDDPNSFGMGYEYSRTGKSK